jgi:hypothetical protein
LSQVDDDDFAKSHALRNIADFNSNEVLRYTKIVIDEMKIDYARAYSLLHIVPFLSGDKQKEFIDDLLTTLAKADEMIVSPFNWKIFGLPDPLRTDTIERLLDNAGRFEGDRRGGGDGIGISERGVWVADTDEEADRQRAAMSFDRPATKTIERLADYVKVRNHGIGGFDEASRGTHVARLVNSRLANYADECIDQLPEYISSMRRPGALQLLGLTSSIIGFCADRERVAAAVEKSIEMVCQRWS